MQTKRSFAMKAAYWLRVVSLGLILGLGLQFAQAWVAPTVAPPGGNVSGPVTTGGNQTKTGSLTVSGGLAAPSLVDSDNVGFYLNPSSLSALYNASISFMGTDGDDDQGLRIDVASANADTLLLLSSADASIAGGSDFIRATDGATGVFVIEGDGDTGIGTTTPTQKLDVNGRIRMATQTVSTDANDIVATKGYVDGKVGGGGSAIYLHNGADYCDGTAVMCGYKITAVGWNSKVVSHEPVWQDNKWKYQANDYPCDIVFCTK